MKHKHYFKFKLGERVSTPNGDGLIISCQWWIDKLETDGYGSNEYVVMCGINTYTYCEDEINRWKGKTKK